MSPAGGKRVGAGRKPKLKDKAKMAFWVERAVLQAAKEQAEQMGITVSDAVRYALEDLAGGRRPRPRRKPKTSRS